MIHHVNRQRTIGVDFIQRPLGNSSSQISLRGTGINARTIGIGCNIKDALVGVAFAEEKIIDGVGDLIDVALQGIVILILASNNDHRALFWHHRQLAHRELIGRVAAIDLVA